MSRLITTIALLFVTLFLSAQDHLRIPSQLNVTEGSYSLSGTFRNGFKTPVKGEPKEILNKLEDYLEDHYQLKTKTKSDGLIGEDLFSAQLSDKHFALNATVTDADLIIWMSLGTDVFVSSDLYPVEAANISKLSKEFLKSYYKTYLDEHKLSAEKQLKSDAKALAKSEKALSREKKDNEKIASKLSKNKDSQLSIEKKIADLNKDLIELAEEQRELAKEKTTAEEKIKMEQENVEKAEISLTKSKEALSTIKTSISTLSNL